MVLALFLLITCCNCCVNHPNKNVAIREKQKKIVCLINFMVEAQYLNIWSNRYLIPVMIYNILYDPVTCKEVEMYNI